MRLNVAWRCMGILSRLNGSTTGTSLLPKGKCYLSLTLYSVDTGYHHKSEENTLNIISAYVPS